MTANHATTLESRLAGAVWGHLVGDAVGVPYEFLPGRPAEAVRFGALGTHRQPPGTWSDDGALMLALLDSLLETGFDPDDQARRAQAWQRTGAYTPDGDGLFDIGGTTSAALHAYRHGTPALDAGPADERACGNGSLMRILPLALVERDGSPAGLIALAHEASRVTHGHPRCQVACAVYSVAVVGLLRGQAPASALGWAFAETLRACHDEPDHAPHLAALEELRGWTRRTGSGYVIDAFWSAWEAFAGATSYEETVRRAVAYGHDTDTTAAIAGGLAGAHWGWEGIPVAWRRGMRGTAVVTPLVDRLVGATGARTSTARPLRVDDIPLDAVPALAGTSGRLGITFLPGKKGDGFTGPHWRDLDLDLARLRELGVDTLFLLNEDRELASCLVPELPEAMAGGLPELVRFPIPDAQTPVDHRAYRAAIGELVERLRAGRSIAIACRGGLDRSGMTASCLLVQAGLEPDAAIRLVQGRRRDSITIPEQQAYVRGWPHVGGR